MRFVRVMMDLNSTTAAEGLPERAIASAAERPRQGCIFSRGSNGSQEGRGGEERVEVAAVLRVWVEPRSHRRVGARSVQANTLYLPCRSTNAFFTTQTREMKGLASERVYCSHTLSA